MPFPLPLDPSFRKEVIQSWIEDVSERLYLNDIESAMQSWQIANTLYVSLPPGQGDFSLEKFLVESRVKIEEHTTMQTNANHQH
jgi:hypothetical protein